MPSSVDETDTDDVLRRLLAPSDWQNPVAPPRYNLVILGAGTAGLVAAAGAAALGAKVALIEGGFLGGDCLNYGCVPSKALIRCARAAFEVRNAGTFGIASSGSVTTDFDAVMTRMRALRTRLAPHDSVERFTGLGVDVYLGRGTFVNPESIEVGGQVLRFKRAVVATGARPTIPSMDGLASCGYLTNETVFSLSTLPKRLAVLGGGPQGCELAQAFQRLGSSVTLIHCSSRLLPLEEGEASAIVAEALKRDGVRVLLGTRVVRVQGSADSEKRLYLTIREGHEELEVDALLICAGRSPNVRDLGLEAAGIAYDENGVKVDAYLRTTNPAVYAAGDVCLNRKFTHAADASARLVVQNALFPLRRSQQTLVIPRCTFTDPEVASVGMTEEAADEAGLSVTAFRIGLDQVDRAVLDGDTEGYIKLLVRSGSDVIAGATIVARHAGDMIGEVSMAMTLGLGVKKLGQVIHPYPTHAEAMRKCADAYARTRLTPFVRGLLGRFMTWGR